MVSAGFLGVCVAACAFGQDAPVDPGYGADRPAAETIAHIENVNAEPSGLFCGAAYGRHPKTPMPDPRGMYPVSHGSTEGLRFWQWPNPRDLYPAIEQAIVLVPLLSPDPLHPLSDAFNAIRKSITDPVSFVFDPAAAWTYQHATKVVDGSPHAKSILWEAISSRLTLWHDQGDYGQVICVLQNNVGIGTPLEPYLGPSVGDPTAINNVLVSPHLTTNLYWQQSFNQNTVRLRVGKISDSGFFDRNLVAYDPMSQFMSLDFNQSITNPFPPRGFGGVLSADLSRNFTLRAGTLNSASTGSTSGFDGLAWNHLFTIVEGDLRVFPTIGGQQREGHIRLMGWHNSAPMGINQETIGGPGVTLNIDQSMADHVSAFMRVGWGQQDVTVSNFAVSAGFSIVQPFGIKSSHTGIAIEYAKITQNGRDAASLNNASPGEHYMLEWYWLTHVSNSVNTGPVIQVVRDRGAGIDTSIIWGWRTTIGF